MTARWQRWLNRWETGSEFWVNEVAAKMTGWSLLIGVVTTMPVALLTDFFGEDTPLVANVLIYPLLGGVVAMAAAFVIWLAGCIGLALFWALAHTLRLLARD